MYLVVEFLSERELSIVPITWTSTDNTGSIFTQWPSHMFPLTLKKAVTKMESTDPSWPVYKIRVLYKTASYRKAEEVLEVLDLYTDQEFKGRTINLKTKYKNRNGEYSSRLSETFHIECPSSNSGKTSNNPLSGPVSMPSSSRRFLPSPPNATGEALPKRMLPSPVNFVQIQSTSSDLSQSRDTGIDSIKQRITSPVQMVTNIRPDLLSSMTRPTSVRQICDVSTTRPKTISNNDTTCNQPLVSVISKLKKTLEEQNRLISSLAEIVEKPNTSRPTHLGTSIAYPSHPFQALQQTIPKRVKSEWQIQHGANSNHNRGLKQAKRC